MTTTDTGCLYPMLSASTAYRHGCRCQRCKTVKRSQAAPYKPRPRKPEPPVLHPGRFTISRLSGYRTDDTRTYGGSRLTAPVVYLVHDRDYNHQTLASFDETTGNTHQRKAAAESLVRALEQGHDHDPTRCHRGHAHRGKDPDAACERCEAAA